MKERIKALAETYAELKKDEAELKHRMGKFDDDVKALVEELTGTKAGEVNVSQLLWAAVDKLG
jgi:hypothetical protein